MRLASRPSLRLNASLTNDEPNEWVLSSVVLLILERTPILDEVMSVWLLFIIESNKYSYALILEESTVSFFSRNRYPLFTCLFFGPKQGCHSPDRGASTHASKPILRSASFLHHRANLQKLY